MQNYLLSVKVWLKNDEQDKDIWAEKLIEGKQVSEELKFGWWWATWPDKVELYFMIESDNNGLIVYTKEVEDLLSNNKEVKHFSEVTAEFR